jgi:hypothetical protein
LVSQAIKQWDVTNRQLQSNAGSKYQTARIENAEANHNESFVVLPADEVISITW